MTSDDNALVTGITELAPRLLTAMEAFEQVQRNMHPPRIPQLAEFITPFEAELRETYRAFKDLEFPADIARFGDQLRNAAEYTLRACHGVSGHDGDTYATMRAMRAICRAQEYVYPLASMLTPVSQYFLEPAARENQGLLGTLNQDRPGERVGIFNAANERDVRGGFSLYIPEYLDKTQPTPVVFAMHGGTGHGADMLWTWLREARTRGFILVSPTSQGDTWSLMGEDIDIAPLMAILDFLGGEVTVDRDHILLTGMSDGATYTLLAGLREGSPFTHLAPFSGVLHPDIQMAGNMRFAQDRPIYLVHGTLDWMFPVETAYMAEQELLAAGAKLTCRIVDGLSHTYCRTEFPAVIEWFDERLRLPA